MKWIKQYGMQRTGTNYAKAIIEKNFADCCVLSNILGWKHGTIEPLNRWIANHTRMGNDGKLCIESEGDKHPIDPFEIQAAIASGEMRYVISVRNPYAFIVGVFTHWNRLNGINWFARRDYIGWIKYNCRKYNTGYADWIRLHRDWPMRSIVMRHEAIVHDPTAVLRAVHRRLDLEPVPQVRSMISGQVEATQDKGTVVSKTAFRRDWYLADGYLERLNDRMVNVIDAEIDWPTMAELGYTKGRNYSNWLHDRKV